MTSYETRSKNFGTKFVFLVPHVTQRWDLMSVWTWSARPPFCHSVRGNHRKQLVACLSNYTQTSTKRELQLTRKL